MPSMLQHRGIGEPRPNFPGPGHLRKASISTSGNVMSPSECQSTVCVSASPKIAVAASPRIAVADMVVITTVTNNRTGRNGGASNIVALNVQMLGRPKHRFEETT
jgi:hypothetical protein